MNAFHGFAMKVDLPDYLRLKIQKYLEYGARNGVFLTLLYIGSITERIFTIGLIHESCLKSSLQTCELN